MLPRFTGAQWSTACGEHLYDGSRSTQGSFPVHDTAPTQGEAAAAGGGAHRQRRLGGGGTQNAKVRASIMLVNYTTSEHILTRHISYSKQHTCCMVSS